MKPHYSFSRGQNVVQPQTSNTSCFLHRLILSLTRLHLSLCCDQRLRMRAMEAVTALGDRHTLSAVCNSLSSAFCPFSCVSLAALFERNRAGQRVSKETENVFEFSTEMFCVFSWCCRRSLFVWRSPTAAKRPILLPVDPVLFH